MARPPSSDRSSFRLRGQLSDAGGPAESKIEPAHAAKLILEHTDDAAFLMDAGGYVRYANGKAAELMGLPTEALEDGPVPIGMNGGLVGIEDVERIVEGSRSVIEGSSTRARFQVELASNESDARILDVRLTGLHGENTPPAVIGIMRDVTRRREAEEALLEARDEAEQMSDLKTSFLANMSHEIRTPLSAILGYAEVLEEEVSPGLNEFVRLIQDSGERLLETLNSVLDLAQIEAGSINLRPAEFDLAALVENTAKAFKRQASEKGLTLEISAEPDSIPGRMDRGLLTRIVTNLTHNAVKFTDDGFVRIHLNGRSDEVELEVVDTGIGIGEAELPHLFQAFRQESRGTRREFDGSGLGLAITKELVGLVDGSIEVESTKGEGTRFQVRLPRYI